MTIFEIVVPEIATVLMFFDIKQTGIILNRISRSFDDRFIANSSAGVITIRKIGIKPALLLHQRVLKFRPFSLHAIVALGPDRNDATASLQQRPGLRQDIGKTRLQKKAAMRNISSVT